MRTARDTFCVVAILLTSGCASLNTPSPPSSYEDSYPDRAALDSGYPDSTDESVTVLQDDDVAVAEDGAFWREVREGFTLSAGPRAAVIRQIGFFTRKPGQVESVLQRGEPYLAYIHAEIKKRDFPGELLLLPFIESGYNPYAYSHGHAAGLWQFIPGTGSRYGLKQDWWYDGRRDIVASTAAALNYLDKLQQDFDGDWLLALAAYNAGEGTIQQAIKRNEQRGRPVDFWNLDLPRETTEYVPKLLAISAIIKHPGKYGVHLTPVDDAPAFTVVNTHAQIDLAVAAELADMDKRQLRELNPGFNRWATRPQGPHRLVVPVEKSELFIQNLAALPPSQRVKWLRHKVQRGDTLSHIARRYDTTVTALREANRLRGNTIRSGQQLIIPVGGQDSARYASLEQDSPRPATEHGANYRVQRGDSLWSVAHGHNISVGQLAQWNNLAPDAPIKAGQQLSLREPPVSIQTGNGGVKPVSYTVRKGDNLFLISQKYNVSVAELKEWNGLKNARLLKPGQKLKLYIDVARLVQNNQG
jgi:membrane-bound lytic murein transglycosylase D